MGLSDYFWPTDDMDFWKLISQEYQVEIRWSKDTFTDYRDLAYVFYKSGFQTFKNIIESGHDNIKSDMWFLSGIFMIRQSMELGLKALLCRIYTKKLDIQAAFKECCHDLFMLWRKYSQEENYLSNEESIWMSTYLRSLELVDSKSDVFRFPFEDEFLAQYRDKFIDIVEVANNMLQAFALIKKCINKGIVDKEDEFDNNLRPEFFIMANHGIGNCYFWQSISDNGFHVKVTGYIEVADFIFSNHELSNEEKVYPVMFLLRNAIELCLKRIFYSSVENGVTKHTFFSKRKSHKIKKDLWKNVRPVIQHYANEQGQDLSIIDLAERGLLTIDALDKNGDIFRYPTSYSLEYRINNKIIDLKTVYEYMRALINFLEGCDSMLDAISDFESEMRSYYEYDAY